MDSKKTKYKKNQTINYKIKEQIQVKRILLKTKFEYERRIRVFIKLLSYKKFLYKNFKKQISIRITHNNVFCTISQLTKSTIKKRTLFVGSAGKYKLHISKKTLRFNNKILIDKFLTSSKRYIRPNEKVLFLLSGPIRIRKHILKQFNKEFKTNKLIIKINPLKCFNGCKVKKQRRKKHKKFVVFKQS